MFGSRVDFAGTRSTPIQSETKTESTSPRRPYVAPAIESERVIEKQLLIKCYTFDEGCEQEPPQS